MPTSNGVPNRHILQCQTTAHPRVRVRLRTGNVQSKTPEDFERASVTVQEQGEVATANLSQLRPGTETGRGVTPRSLWVNKEGSRDATRWWSNNATFSDEKSPIRK